MGISSLGVGSSILTQDVIDQLRGADEAKFVAPVNVRITEQNSKTAAFDVLDAHMDNVYESLKSLTEYGVFEARTASVSNDSIVDITAADSSDVQDFTIDVEQLATKQIEQSGSFKSKEDKIANGAGVMELSVGDLSFEIDYEKDTTLEELKELINKTAGDSVNATIVQVNDKDYRLLLSAVNTGIGSEISIKDLSIKDDDKHDDKKGNLSTSLTEDLSNVQTATDAKFTFNGLDITRSTNSVDDLLSGVTLTLKDTGKVDGSVKQDRANIEGKITSFVDKYNSAIFQLTEDTKSSQDEDERGAFSNDSTIKNMKRSLENILSTVGQGAGRLDDYGISLDDDGRLSLDSEILNTKLDKDPTSVQAFFVGGTFTQEDTYVLDADGNATTTIDKKGFTVELKGVFSETENEVAKYSKYNSVLDQFKDSIDVRLKSLTEQKEKAIARLDSTYEIMAKRFASYDAVISKFSTASDMFTQMINTEANNN